MADPIPGGRNRPDGERLEWQTARSPKPDVPFLCGDITPRQLRVQEGEVCRHPNGVTGVARLIVAVNDVDVSAKRYAALLGADAPSPEEGIVGDAPARMASFRLANGTTVTLASPLGADGELAKIIAERGEGPFAAVFAARGGEPRALDPALTHGARLSVA